MLLLKRLAVVSLAVALLGPFPPLEARTRKGDKLLAQGKQAELKKDWDTALNLYEQALSEDPSDVAYQIAAGNARFQASQAHIDRGLKMRAQGLLGEALLEFQKAFAINPSSAAAEQEIKRTQQMIERARRKAEETGKEPSAEEKALTPVQEAKKEEEQKMERMLPAPELRPLNSERINLRMANQPPKVLFETVGKVAGINVLWSPDYKPDKNQSVDLNNLTIEQALDYLSVLTKSFWQALSPNTILIANDDVNNRHNYEENVLKVFYLSNVFSPAEMTEVTAAVRGATDCQRLFPFNSQRAIIARCEADKMALAEKIINDLDKPRPEVVVDVLVLQVSDVYSRQISTALISGGLNVPLTFTGTTTTASSTSSTTTATTGTSTTSTTGSTTGVSTGATTTGTTSTTGTAGTAVPLSQLGHLASSDFSVILPSALLQAVLSDTGTKVLQAPQIRSVDNVKATLNVGDREPTATGSFQPGVGGVGINPLVNTQFTYIDVGVNIALTPIIHDNGDVSMHVQLDISDIDGTVNLGGINQPIIGQRKIEHDIRMREGEVNLLGGLAQIQESKQVTGIPGLSSIPLLGHLFTGDQVNRNTSELMIALIPHIVRRHEITPENLREVAAGNFNVIKLNYGPRRQETAGSAPAPSGNAAAASPGAPTATPPTPEAPPAAGAQPAAPALAPPATAPPPPPLPLTPPAGAGQAPPSPNTIVSFSPAQANTNVGGQISVDLVVTGGNDIASAPFEIQFDPKILRLNDVVQGDFLGRDGQQVNFTKNIQNDGGVAAIQLSRLPGAPGISGSGKLVTLSFQAVGPGAAMVSVPNLTLRNSQGQPGATATPSMTVNVK
jgi:general secretion pathway protein D